MVRPGKNRPNQDKSTTADEKPRRGRLIVGIGVIVLLLAVGGGVAAYMATQRVEEVTVDWNEVLSQVSELASVERHAEVVERIGDLNADLNDIERTDVLRLFAESRLRVSLPGNNHMREAIAVFRRILLLEPNDHETIRKLFFLYRSMSEQELAIEFGGKYLAAAAGDVEVAIAMGEIYLEMRKSKEAAALAARVLESEMPDLEAVRISVRAQIMDGVSEEEITDWMQELVTATADRNSPLSLDALMLVYARESGDQQLATILLQKVAKVASASPRQRLFAAAELREDGESMSAARVLSQGIAKDTVNATGDTRSDDSLVVTETLLYQRMQLGQFDKVLELIEDQFHGSDAYDDQIIAVEYMAHRLSDNQDALPELAEKLAKIETQFSRVWSPLIAELSVEEIDGTKLITLAETGIETYPGSAYLYYWKGFGLELVGASDQAIEAYRAASRIASGWVIPRLRLASLFEARGDYETALVESAMALRVNPGLQPALDRALGTAIRIFAEKGEIPEDLGTPILGVVDAIVKAPEARQDRDLFRAIGARLNGDRVQADRYLSTYLESVGELTSQQFRTLRLVATDTALQERISKLQESVFGVTTSELLSAAVDAARKEGIDTGVQYLADYSIRGEKIPDFTLRLLTCQLYTILESDRQLGAWKDFAETNRTNAAVLNLVLRIPVIRQDEQTRAQLVSWLKESFPEGIDWEIQQIAMELDGDEGQKQAARAVFRLNELARLAPTSRPLYGLMAIAFERLDQPFKAIEALNRAVENGAELPQYRTRLAELLAQQGEASLAINNALAVTGSRLVSVSLRRRAVRVLSDLGEFAKAANATKLDLPANLSDSDDDFATASLFVVSSVRAGDHEGIPELLADLPSSKDRWFNLYLALTNTRELPVEVAEKWLSDAQNWLQSGSVIERHRNLATAWRKLASRSTDDKRTSCLQNAAGLLAKVIDDSPTAADRIIFASLQEQTGNVEEARRLYTEIADGKLPREMRAFALNNLSLMTTDLDTAATHARKAIELDQRADYLDTMAIVLTKQGKRDDALRLLSEGLVKYDDHVGIRIRLAEMLLDDARLERASELLTELAQADRLSTNLTTRQWQKIRSLQTRCTRLIEETKDSSTLPVVNPETPAANDSI